MEIFGYIRVSSADQNEVRQMLAIRGKGVPMKNIYVDKQSGENFERPQYKKLVKAVEKGDLLYILSIDRLGRNYGEIQRQWRMLVNDMGVDICVIDMPVLDTRSYKDLLGIFISDLVLQILSFVAQTERENIKQRQSEGIAAAKLRGVKFGRPSAGALPQYDNAIEGYRSGALTAAQAIELTGLSKSTFYRRVKEYEAKKGES